MILRGKIIHSVYLKNNGKEILLNLSQIKIAIIIIYWYGILYIFLPLWFMKNILTYLGFIISTLLFIGILVPRVWATDSYSYSKRFSIEKNCDHYEWCTNYIIDNNTKNKMTYGKDNSLWGDIELIRTWVSGVFVLLNSVSGDGIFLCSYTTWNCRLIISTEQLTTTKSDNWLIFNNLYDFELLTGKRIKIFLVTDWQGGDIKTKIIKFDWSQTSMIDEISRKLEESEVYWPYTSMISNWVSYRVWKSTQMSVNHLKLTRLFNVKKAKLWFINLFSVQVNWVSSSKKIIEKYFIDSQYRKYCSVNRIDTKKEITNIDASKEFYDSAYISTNLFYGKNEWDVYTIDINKDISDSEKDEVIENQYCYWIWHSSPSRYFIFKKNDTSKFLLINTTQDPYPFNPRSFEF